MMTLADFLTVFVRTRPMFAYVKAIYLERDGCAHEVRHSLRFRGSQVILRLARKATPHSEARTLSGGRQLYLRPELLLDC